MAALSVFRSQSFFARAFSNAKKRISAQAGLRAIRRLKFEYDYSIEVDLSPSTKTENKFGFSQNL